MNRKEDQNNPEIVKELSTRGYIVKQTGHIEQIEAFFYRFEHSKTGANFIHISGPDTENTFGMVFKTVPIDSTGSAHILEHIALSGSAKYPVKDPFFSMLKRTLSTFMNAFTSSDWTMYPFSTQNKKDFYNLMDVYLDAAFFPNLNELSFKQEGCRLDIEKDGSLVYKGVVYNEMKGVLSSPDNVMALSLLESLYPDTTYSNNSGGDPKVIPTLTLEKLRSFHSRHYHPCNAFFYTYGNFKLIEHLNFIEDRVLNRFDKIETLADVPSQPRWKEPKTVSFKYPLGTEEDPSKKYHVCSAWLTADITETFEIIGLMLLSHILLGTPASPLRKALIDSKLGSSLSYGTGFDSDNKDTMFAVGLRDVEENSAGKIESIIFDTLKKLITDGIEEQLVKSAIHQFEFQSKEVTNTPYPYGIKLLLSFAGSWLHRGDPKAVLEFDSNIKKLCKELDRGPFFENFIKKYLIDNPHKILLKMIPDKEVLQTEQKRVSKELEKIKKSLSKKEVEKIKQESKALKALHEKQENLSILPTLELSDISAKVKIVKPYAYKKLAVCYKKPTSGIFYFSSASGLEKLDKRLIPLVPFFCFAVTRSATRAGDYVKLAQRIDSYTGGIELIASAKTKFDESGRCMPFISFLGKCLDRNIDKMIDLIEEIASGFDLSDTNRLENLTLQYIAAMESVIVDNGHRLAVLLASRNFSKASAFNEIWGGIHQLQKMRQVSKNIEKLSKDLTSIGERLVKDNYFKIALVGSDSSLSKGYKMLENSEYFSRAAGLEANFMEPDIDIGHKAPVEGWYTSTTVSFVARVFKTVSNKDYKESPALAVISKLLHYLFLFPEIREKRGAYGAFADYDIGTGLFSFASYRDPCILETLDTYRAAFDFIKSGQYSKSDIKEAILQVCSKIDKPHPPGQEALKAFYRSLLCLSDEKRARFKDAILSIKKADIVRVAEKYFEHNAESGIAVISSETQLNTVGKKVGLKICKI